MTFARSLWVEWIFSINSKFDQYWGRNRGALVNFLLPIKTWNLRKSPSTFWCGERESNYKELLICLSTLVHFKRVGYTVHSINQTSNLGMRQFQTVHSELRGVFKYEFGSCKLRRCTRVDEV